MPSGDELVIVDAAGRHTNRCNPTASLVWQLCDEGVTLDQVASELDAAFGAPPGLDDDVRAVAARLVAAHLVQTTDPAATPTVEPEPGPGPHHLPAPCSPCGDAVDALGWHELLAVRRGDHHIGVRSGAPLTSELLCGHLGDRIVDDPDVLADLSLVLLDHLDDDPLHPRSGWFADRRWMGEVASPDDALARVDGLLAWLVPLPGSVGISASASLGEAGAVLMTTAPGVGDHRELGGPVEVCVGPAGVEPQVRATGRTHPLVAVVVPWSEVARLDPGRGLEALTSWLRPELADRRCAVQDLVDIALEVPVVGAPQERSLDIARALARRGVDGA